jgi:hypothetical protein
MIRLRGDQLPIVTDYFYNNILIIEDLGRMCQAGSLPESGKNIPLRLDYDLRTA